jgi:hypothetical protein
MTTVDDFRRVHAMPKSTRWRSAVTSERLARTPDHAAMAVFAWADTADFCPPFSYDGLNPKRQTSKSQRSPSTEILSVIGYWSFLGVWTTAIWDFQRTGYPIAVQESAVLGRKTKENQLAPAAPRVISSAQ